MITNIKLFCPDVENPKHYFLEYEDTELKDIGEDIQLLSFESLEKVKDFIKRLND